MTRKSDSKYLLCMGCLFLSLFFSTLCVYASQIRRISFLSLNDFHAAVEPVKAVWLEGEGQIGGAVCLAGYVAQFRKEDPNLIWVVGGDMFMGHYLDSLTQGKAMIEFLNIIPPDAFVLGNHEFDYGMDVLKERITESGFPIICANIKMKDGTPLVQPCMILERGGIKILIIGVICRNLPRIVSVKRLRDVEVTDPVTAIRECIKNFEQDMDLTVILSHSGIHEDRRIARALPPESGVDIIIGGHSHTLMETPEKINGIILCQAGSKGRYLGSLEVDLDLEEKRIASYHWQLVPTLCDHIKPHRGVGKWLAKRTKKIEKEMAQVIGNLNGHWTRDKDEWEWAVANFATDAIAEAMAVDIGIYNRGGIRQSLSGPKIRVKDIWGIFPFGNYLIRFQLTGKQVRTLLETHLSLSGEHLFFSRALRYSFDPKRPSGRRLVDITIRGKPLDPEHIYTLATVEFLWGHAQKAFGLSQETIKANGGFKESCDQIEREIFIHAIREQKRIDARLDGRVKMTTSPLSFLMLNKELNPLTQKTNSSLRAQRSNLFF